MSTGQLANIYRTFERGQTPSETTVPSDDGAPQTIIATSLRGDVVVAERVAGTDATYNLIRVEPREETGSQQMHRHIRSGGRRTPGKRQFDHCEYQLKRAELPMLDGSTPQVATRVVTDAGRWKRGATAIRTAHSARQLQSAWDEWTRTSQ